MHPGSRILSYILAALVIPGLSFFALALALLGALLGVVWLGRKPLRLIWRTRWLLLILALGYGFNVPGDALWSALGEWSPSRQGLLVGLERALHLAVLLLWLDVLVLSLSSQQMMSGLYALMSPLAHLGMDVRRPALRLALTLKAIELLEQGSAPGAGRAGRGRGGNLRHLFDPVPGDRVPEHVVLMHYPVRGRDFWAPILLLACMGWLVWSGGGP